MAWWKEILNAVSKASFTLRQWNLKTAFSIRLKTRQMFSLHNTLGKFWNAATTSLIWISVWARLGERNHVIMVTSSFMKSSAKPSFSNSSCLKSISENEKLCFRDGLVWTVGLTINIKLRFEISPCGWRFKFFFANFSHTNPSLIKVLYNLSTEGLIPECCGHFQLVRWHAGWLNTSSRQRTLEWSWYGKWTLSTEHALLFYLSKSKN